LRFAANEAVVSLNDRLLGANSEALFDEIRGDVETVAKQLFGGAEFSLEHDKDARQRLNVHVKTSASVDLSQALDNLSRN
jgi:hypothetical protein